MIKPFLAPFLLVIIANVKIGDAGPVDAAGIQLITRDKCTQLFGPCQNIGEFRSVGECQEEFCECSSTSFWVSHKCSTPLKFSPQTNKCQWQHEVRSCKTTNFQPTINEGQVALPSILTKDKCTRLFGACQNLREFRPMKACGHEFCECSSTGYWVDYQCSTPLKFSPETNNCEWQKDVAGCKSTIFRPINQGHAVVSPTTTTDKCTKLFGSCKSVGEFRSTKTCSQDYCQCSSTGFWVNHQCKAPLKFNNQKNICEWQKDVPDCK